MRILFAAALSAAVVPAAALADAMPIEAGLWEVRSTITAIDMPGAPPEVIQMMKGKPQSMRHCITPEQAAKGPQELLRQSKGECKFTKYAFAGGKMDAVMQCASKDRGTMTAATQGSFTPTSYATVGKMVMAGPQGKMTMSVAGNGRRLGPCAK